MCRKVPAESILTPKTLEFSDKAIPVDLAQIMAARRARVMELRVFGGLTIEEAAKVLGLLLQSVRPELEASQSMAVLRNFLMGAAVHINRPAEGTAGAKSRLVARKTSSSKKFH